MGQGLRLRSAEHFLIVLSVVTIRVRGDRISDSDRKHL